MKLNVQIPHHVILPADIRPQHQLSEVGVESGDGRVERRRAVGRRRVYEAADRLSGCDDHIHEQLF